MLRQRCAIVLVRARRDLLGLVMAIVLLSWTLGPLAPLGAAQPQRPPGPEVGPVQGEPPPEPAAYLQVVIKNIHIRDDHDGFPLGAGDFSLTVGFWRCSGTSAEPCSVSPDNPAVLIARWDHSFDADDQETVPLERLLPLALDTRDASASEETGIAVYAGQRYLLDIGLVERDPDEDDLMGGVQTEVDESNHWGIAVYPSVNSYSVSQSLPYPGGGFCAGWFCGYDRSSGDYDVTYEIRRTPLPDLHPTAIRVEPNPSGGERVCARIENRGQTEAVSLEVIFRLDGAVLGTVRVHDGLDAGQSRELCINANLPDAGLHTLLVSVDESRAVPEMDETNNQLQTRYAARVGGAGPVVGPLSPAPELPDLIVSGIRVQGTDPSGLNDCDPGRNTVWVVVKNQGTAPAGGFQVRLVVDNEEVYDTPNTLDSGQARELLLSPGNEREVRFENVSLDKGEHTLVATVDPNNAVAESNNDNNKLAVTANCKKE